MASVVLGSPAQALAPLQGLMVVRFESASLAETLVVNITPCGLLYTCYRCAVVQLITMLLLNPWRCANQAIASLPELATSKWRVTVFCKLYA
jgi:threonine/homoserine efflux transporter RhtA